MSNNLYADGNDDENDENNKTIPRDLKCGICLELFIEPTTLTCGHTVCRHCLAQWWCNTNDATCPICRQAWHGFPKVNVTLRNTIEALFTNVLNQRKLDIQQDANNKRILDRFEEFGHLLSARSSNSSSSNTVYFVLVFCVVVGVGIVSLFFSIALSTKTNQRITTKPLKQWTSRDVSTWVGGLGEWAKPYEKVFLDQGIDGSLLDGMSDAELSNVDVINTTMTSQRRKLLLTELGKLKEELNEHSYFDLWQYKEKHGEMLIFLIIGMREYPRSIIVYLCIFNYWHTFLPMFHLTLHGSYNGDFTTLQQLIYMEQSPFLYEWFLFIGKLVVVPYFIVYQVAAHFFVMYYWTSRLIIVHAIIKQINEFTNNIFMNIRSIPNISINSFGRVAGFFLLIKLFWRFVPSFVADLVLYWMLYATPIEALYTFIKYCWRRARYSQNTGDVNVDEDSNQPQQRQPFTNNFSFRFNFENRN